MGFSPMKSSDDDEFQDNIVAEINITPLTDVFLVLLIIFMVGTTIMSQVGVDVNLPQASKSVATSQPKGVIVSLSSNGGMKVNGVGVETGNFKELQSLIEAAFTKTPDRLVVLEGDSKAFLGNVVDVMDAASKAGAKGFAMSALVEN